MSQPTFEARTTTTPYLKPAYAPSESRLDERRIDRLVERASRAQSSEMLGLQEGALSRLARESFEAGFAAGAARAFAAEGAADAAGGRPDDSTIRTTPRSDHDSSAGDIASPEPIRALSPRRFEVLELVARGLTNPEIASVLGISANTVKAHLASILEVLDVSNRTEAAMALQDYERRVGESAR